MLTTTTTVAATANLSSTTTTTTSTALLLLLPLLLLTSPAAAVTAATSVAIREIPAGRMHCQLLQPSPDYTKRIDFFPNLASVLALSDVGSPQPAGASLKHDVILMVCNVSVVLGAGVSRVCTRRVSPGVEVRA